MQRFKLDVLELQHQCGAGIIDVPISDRVILMQLDAIPVQCNIIQVYALTCE